MSINSSKKIYGLVGYPVKHSLSPAMHMAAFKHCGIDAEYKLFEVKPDELQDFLKNLNKKNIYGLNVTVPYKVKALDLVKNMTTVTDNDMSILLTGAINTIKVEEGKLICRNTDVSGFLQSLINDLKPKDVRNCLLIGCGGAGRAVIAALEMFGKDEVYVYDINNNAVNSAKKFFSSLWRNGQIKKMPGFINECDKMQKIITKCQLLINASPIGMKEEDGSAIARELLHKNLYVYDLVYNRETQLIKDANQKCKAAVNGLGMLLYQGAAAWEFWMEQKAPVEKMREALKTAMEDKC